MEMYEEHNKVHNGGSSNLRDPDRPILYLPYPKTKEIRMDMREWIQNNKCMQQGTHFPLCIKLGGTGRRSEEKQLERIRGTPNMPQSNVLKMRREAPPTLCINAAPRATLPIVEERNLAHLNMARVPSLSL